MVRRFDEDDTASTHLTDVTDPADATDDVRKTLEKLRAGQRVGAVQTADGEWRPDVASPARMYDYYLGGKDHSLVDAEAAERVLKFAPSIRTVARANRAFMHRAVAWAAQRGIDQFVDVGTGIPTEPNPYQIARRYRPDAVVVGVDNDPVVLAHDRALLEGMPIVRGDVRAVDELITDLGAWIDWGEPVAVLLIAILHFITDDENPARVVEAFTERMAPGSVVVLSHVSSTGADREALARAEQVYQDATAPAVSRTHEQIMNLFGRLELVPPGVVPVQHWPIEAGPLTKIPILGGVGIVPEPTSST